MLSCTQLINDYWLPLAIKCGISISEFRDMTPKQLNIFKSVREEQIQEEYDKINYTAWLNGVYFGHAIGSSIFPRNKYPNKPFDNSKSVEDSENDAVKFAQWVQAFNRTLKHE